ncbi:hypothetical protein WAI05_21315, partial [Acinetobacter baumannii]
LVIALGLLNLQLIQLITAFKEEKTLVWPRFNRPHAGQFLEPGTYRGTRNTQRIGKMLLT